MKCLICNQDVISYKHNKFDILFHECFTCELIFKDETNYPSINLELKQYNFHQNDIDNIGYVNFLTNFIDTAVIPFIQFGKALDFGSGPNPVLSKILIEKYHFECDIYDKFYANNLSYLDNKYDLITLTEVIEHLSNPVQVFQTFNKILKPNGILSIMTLFHEKNRQKFSDWFYIRDVTHLTFYTPKTIEFLGNLTGFNLVYTNDYRVIVLKKRGEINE
jgi:SAM-dependent methyltransferase